MKTKLSVLLLYLCSLTLFAACSNNRQKQKTPAENVATPIRNFLKQKYPLQSSAYNQYKIEDITAIERPDGLFYDFELKQDNNEIHIILDSEAKIVIKSSTIAPGYDW